MYQNGVGSIHGHDFDTGAVDFDVGIRQDILDCLYKSAKGSGLHCADAEQVLRVVNSTCCRGSSRLSLGAASVAVTPARPAFPAIPVAGTATLSGLSLLEHPVAHVPSSR